MTLLKVKQICFYFYFFLNSFHLRQVNIEHPIESHFKQDGSAGLRRIDEIVIEHTICTSGKAAIGGCGI